MDHKVINGFLHHLYQPFYLLTINVNFCNFYINLSFSQSITCPLLLEQQADNMLGRIYIGIAI